MWTVTNKITATDEGIRREGPGAVALFMKRGTLA